MLGCQDRRYVWRGLRASLDSFGVGGLVRRENLRRDWMEDRDLGAVLLLAAVACTKD